MRRPLTWLVPMLVFAGPASAQSSQSFQEAHGTPKPEQQITARNEFAFGMGRFRSLRGVDEALATVTLQQQHQAERRWVARHPILTAMLVGAGAGAVIGAATCTAGMLSSPDCSSDDRVAAGLISGGYGAAAGAFWGAVIEWLVVR